MPGTERFLIVTADDFGIGPATSEGVLDAAAAGAITASVLLVNSPHAKDAVRQWRQRRCPMELGWHPNLTLDRPILLASEVPSLAAPNGNFWPLRVFLQRWLLGRVCYQDVERELNAQLEQFCQLTGQQPMVVNTHQHVGVFPPVGRILLEVLERHGCKAFLRRVRENADTLWHVRGARGKRALLTLFGRGLARTQEARHHAGNDCLLGITDPKWVKKPTFYQEWLRAAGGAVVELMCHPGHRDTTLVGRDCRAGDGLVERRVDELRLLKEPAFLDAVRAAGFTLVSPSQYLQRRYGHGQVA